VRSALHVVQIARADLDLMSGMVYDESIDAVSID
jgi:hypothetical protein